MFRPIAAQTKAAPISLGASGERMVNYFLRPSEGVSPAPAIGRTGLTADVDLGGAVRAVMSHNDAIYAVAAGKLWSIAGTVATELGALVDDRNTYIAANNEQVGVVAGGQFYLWDGTTLSGVVTGAIDTLTGLAQLGGYFIVSGSSAGRKDAIGWSAIDNGTAWNALDFAFAENESDAIVGLVEDHGELWLFGTKTVEIWYQSGSTPPFAPNTGAAMETGCLQGGGVAKLDNAVFWVTEDNTVVRAAGSSPAVISTREVEELLDGATIERGFGFMDRGHKFYAVQRKDASTLVFDVTTGLWSEFTSGVGEGAWLAGCADVHDGVWRFGTSTGKLCSQSGYEDDGQVIRGEIVSVPVEGPGYAAVGEVRLTVQTGEDDVNREAQIMMQTTKDGYNWGREKWRPLGRLGERHRRVRWNGLGAFERFQCRFRVTDNVARDIYGVYYA